jgi:hypothetical protein
LPGGCPIGTLAGEFAETSPDSRADLAAGFDLWASAISRGLHAMHDRGDLRRGEIVTASPPPARGPEPAW